MADTNLMTALPVASSRMFLNYGQELSGTQGGAIIVADLRPALWSLDVESAMLDRGKALQAEALFALLDGSLSSFYGWNPKAQYPQADPMGSIVGAAAVKIKSLNADNKRLALKALPAGYVLTRGDFLAFDYGAGPSRALHQVMAATVTADGSGDTAEFEVRPHIRTGAAVDDAVNLKRPAAEMLILPGSVQWRQAAPLHDSVAFQATQKL